MASSVSSVAGFLQRRGFKLSEMFGQQSTYQREILYFVNTLDSGIDLGHVKFGKNLINAGLFNKAVGPKKKSKLNKRRA